MIMDQLEEKIKKGAIDYLSPTTNFDFILDKIKIDYSHR
jgi:hypothetical protein